MSAPSDVEVLRPPTQAELRDELESLAVDHLLGPEGGPTEELSGDTTVRDYYLVGMLAPQGVVSPPEERDRTGVDSDDDDPNDDGGAAPALIPSSMGMTFAVEPGVDAVEVSAAWGRYQKGEVDTGGDGRPARVWRRQPCGGTFRLQLADGPVTPTPPDPEWGDVVVSGRVRRRADATSVTLFLVNGQATVAANRDERWLFQVELAVAGVDGAAIFVQPATEPPGRDTEARSLAMLYRRHVELATGHGTAVHVTTDPADPTRATRVATRALPTHEVPRTEAPTLGDLRLDMAALADADDLAAALTPLVVAYRAWIDGRQADLDAGADGLDAHREAGAAALGDCRLAAGRIQAGIDLVVSDERAERAFRFANRAMALQRVHTMAAARRRGDDPRRLADVVAEVDLPENRSWRPFQLAFVLLNLPSLTDPAHQDRTGRGVVDLLWFPTGGGKTEAYLGLCAYTLATRRLQGVVADHDGSDGVGVLMRYTLRLLTAQQFQRAAALMCACEVLRRRAVADGDNPWGEVPFRIGLWVGYNVTPNRGSQAEKAIDRARDRGRQGRGANPVQLAACPWCGAAISAARDARYDQVRRRTIVHCGDRLGRCPFSQRHARDEGLPVVTVDDELYRLLPGLVIATADKLAQLPWQGALSTLFGRVSQRCERHGYRSPDLDDVLDETDSHRARGSAPAARTVPAGPLRPPDLIIQDELHLMTGPLGSLAGLYETAVDDLCTWVVDGTPVRPKVVASTATARRATEQAAALFGRDLQVFPPQGIDIADSFFARQVAPSPETPGRRYLGVCAHGRRLKAVEIRVYVALMGAAQLLHERHGADVDPWMTLVGYFSSLRELGGMRRLVDDDVRSRLARIDRRGLGRRHLNDVAELTSRMDSSEIPAVLDRLGVPFDGSDGSGWPIDVLLATNMVSVGVDVPRLGLMVVGGQPKATAEYIQATSRVGRSAPGLVVTISNWARPRDLSHYERFEHYHATFYRHVEATTLTPFAPRAVDRGLTGVMTGMIRHRIPEWNGNDAARLVDVDDPAVADVVATIRRRATDVTGRSEAGDDVAAELRQRLQAWSARQTRQQTGILGYRGRDDGVTTGLLHQPAVEAWDLWTCPNSLREVEPGINLLFDATDYSAFSEPDWSYGDEGSDRGTAEAEEPS